MLIHLDSKKYHFWVQDMRMPELKIIEPAFNINYDLEQQDTNEWLLHIDAGAVYGEKGEFESRSTFKALCSEEEIFTHDVMVPALKKSVEYSRRRLTAEMRTYEANCPPVKKLPKNFWQQQADTLIGQFQERGKITEEDPSINAEHITLKCEGNASFLLTFTMQIIYNMISRSYPFKIEENRKFFNQYVPEHLWKRIYFKCNEIIEQDVKLTVKETVMLYYCIDCASQCMAGKTFENLKKAIYDWDWEMRKRDVTSERKHFLALAENFKEKVKLNLPSAGFAIANFNTPVSWDDGIISS
jgi:hypothetical protein